MNETLEMPARVARLPRDRHHRPVPWFVVWLDDDGHQATPDTGTPDFRVGDGYVLHRAVTERRCWICGDPLGAYKAFTIGPMCAVNRVSAEPPSHRDCAAYSAQVCPFLSTPAMRRRDARMPDGVEGPAGIMLRRNPGVTLVWVTRSFQVVREGEGLLFRIGDPTETLWYAEGREATREEVVASIDSGLPALREVAEEEGPKAVAELEAMHGRALAYLPA